MDETDFPVDIPKEGDESTEELTKKLDRIAEREKDNPEFQQALIRLIIENVTDLAFPNIHPAEELDPEVKLAFKETLKEAVKSKKIKTARDLKEYCNNEHIRFSEEPMLNFIKRRVAERFQV